MHIKTKITLYIFIFFILFLGLTNHAFAVTEFVSIVDPGGSSESDYSSLSTWETGLQTNLTAPSTLVFVGTVGNTAPGDNAAVVLYRAGNPVGIGASVVHTAKAGNKILLESVTDTNPASYQNGDIWRDASNANISFTIDATAPDSAQVTAKCRTTNGAADTAKLSISGWDTDDTHYIKVYTDPNENYRHKGVWDENKYRLVPSSNSSAIDNYEDYVRIDGLQLKVLSDNSSDYSGIYFGSSTTASEVHVSNNIMEGFVSNSTGGTKAGLNFYNGTTLKAWNNIIYGFSGSSLGAGVGIRLRTFSNAYVSNNTVVGCNTGASNAYGSPIVFKNNLLYNNTDNYNATLGGTSTNNLSGPGSDAQISGSSNPQNGVTVTFADEANNDFHLDSSDTGAKNHGADLSADGNIAVTTDIDNETHRGTFDIGADENVAAIYRSVGAGATAALVSGGNGSNYGYMEIKPAYLNVGSTANLTDHIATFWRALPDNVGVGDAISYDADNSGGIDNTVFITKRIDSTHYSVRKADGTAPTPTSSLYNTGWNIRRAYTSLSDAEAGTENIGIGRTFDAGNVNLTTDNLQWNFAMYANGTAADTTAVTIAGWTTAADNYLKIYTPTRTDEVGVSQRHSGKWDTSKYYLEVSNSTALDNLVYNARFDGLQIHVASVNADSQMGFRNYNIGAQNVWISNSIIRGVTNATNRYHSGILNERGTGTFKAWNNVVYDFKDSYSTGRLIAFSAVLGEQYIYNNTVQNGDVGLYQFDGNVYAKNNLIKSATTAASGTFAAGTSYNATDNVGIGYTVTGGAVGDVTSATINFTDETGDNFHLASGATNSGRNAGTDLSNDLYLPIKTDIDSSGSRDGKNCPIDSTDNCETRPYNTSWDIGADELITKIYRSVGVGTTAAIISGTAQNITLTISGTTGTFSTFPTSAAFGVGDVIRYDSDNNGTVDSTAFITAIDSTAKTATLQAADGSQPTQMAVADLDWKLYRAYTSLSDWESGTENTGVGVTYDAGNLDIASRSEQWNVACYSPAGTDTTAADTAGTSISGWTTKQQNYIKVYSPTASTEVTTSQRHQGKWDDTKYHINRNLGGIYIYDNYVRIDGIQIKVTAASGTPRAISVDALTAGDNKFYASNNIITFVSTGATDMDGIFVSNANDVSYIWNNIVYNAYDDSIVAYGTSYVYNNTIIGGSGTLYGIRAVTSGGVTAKNNIVNGIPTAANTYNGTFNAASDYNATDSTDDIGAGSHNKTSQTFSFIDSTNKDFHLSQTDTAARNSGVDLTKDIYFPVTSDINGHGRPSLHNGDSVSTWDIGADEAATTIYRSIAPSATSAIASGTNPANSLIISGTSATFGTAPGTTVGVGDAIQYDSDNNGTIDSIAFISSRISSTSYTVQSHDGGTPTSTTATDYDWSIFRAYTTMRNALGYTGNYAGTENTGISDNVEHFDQDVGADHYKDIYAPNQQWNYAAYANGTTADSNGLTVKYWTTYLTNYVKIYTPTASTEVGTSQRHQGKYDTSKYHLETSNETGISNYLNNLRVEGIQIKQTLSNYNFSYGISSNASERWDADIRLTGNIIQGALSGTSSSDYGILAAVQSGSQVSQGNIYKISNNIVYNYANGANENGGIYVVLLVSPRTAYVYNNTVFNSYRGYSRTNGAYVAKNNIAQNCTDGYNGTFDSTSDYNISDVDASDAPNATFTNDYATVTFSDEANSDFHLAANDTAARNSGADLSSDTYITSAMGITSDIDGHSRSLRSPTSWDIGADQGATHIYYSVGQSTATDLKTGTPTIGVSGTAATFNTAQTGNIGVGDKITYTGGSCYISGKQTTSIWNCQNATGGTAVQVNSGTSVTSITRAFSSLNQAIGTGGSAADSNHLNTTDFQTNNYVVNIPCYYDTGADTTAVQVSGYTTAVPNYIKIYTPNNTTTEANNSQRHSGKWDDTKYKLTQSDFIKILDVVSSHVRLDGLQIGYTGGGYEYMVTVANGTKVSNSIFDGNNISAKLLTINEGSVWNSVFYDSTERGIYSYTWGTTTAYVYNNTIYNCLTGIYLGASGQMVAKNNVVQGTLGGGDGYYGSFTSSDYNISDQANDAPSASYRNNLATTVSFQDLTNYDFHLGIGDTAARNYGVNLSVGSTAPGDFAFTTDIDGSTRNTDSRGWDIGADEAATQVFYSVGQSTSDLKVASLVTVSADNITFGSAQTGNIGVGDKVVYNDGTERTCYISGKTSTTVWSCQNITGGTASQVTNATLTSIKHVWTTLNGAMAGIGGTAGVNTTDLQTNNYQVNIPCYYDSAADTTAVSISGYTTGPTTYIRAYTPYTSSESNNSQRHQGKWDDNKYKLEVTNPGNGSYNSVIGINESYVKIDGIQMELIANSSDNRRGIMTYSSTDSSFSNNIVRGNISSGATNSMHGIYTNAGTLRVWNNVVYGFNNSASTYSSGLWSGTSGITTYAYNNAFYDNINGIRINIGTVYAKNNISYNNTDNYVGSFGGGSTNNLSGPTQTDAPGTAPQNGVTVKFVDEAHKDFHLAKDDTAARNTGASLYTDSNLPVTSDIDGNPRSSSASTSALDPRTYDIGADEGATYIYYSVGQNTSDHKTGSPNITVSGYTATLTVGQTATNMGVGDLITYTGGSCFISGKTSTTQWNCQNATGGTAAQVSGVSVTSIAHAFDSLGGTNGALKSTSTGAKDSSHLNTSNLYTGNYILNIPTYYDSGADASAVTISSWTTAQDNYIKIYTPSNTSSEVNQSQRHSGAWNDGKYKMEVDVGGGDSAIDTAAPNTYIEGLQIKVSNSSAVSTYGIELSVNNKNSDIRISNNIIKAGTVSSGSYSLFGVEAAGSRSSKQYIWNNIFYDFSTGSAGAGITESTDTGYTKTAYVYNNTIVNCYRGLYSVDARSTFYAKNNIVKGSGDTNAYVGTFGSGTDYNSTDGTDTTGQGANSRISQTFSFTGESDDNFHLAVSDTGARNHGTNLSNDPYLWFDTDIDGNPRTGDWSIGADDGPFVEVQSPHTVDTDATAGLDYGLVMYQTFDGGKFTGSGIGSTALDSSGQNNNGILSGTAPGPTRIEGKRGQALSFDGTDDYANVTDSSSLSTTTAVTMVTWFKTTASMSSGSRALINKNLSYGLALGQGSNNRYVQMSIRQNLSTDSYSTTAPYAVNDGNWHFLASTFDGDFIKLYFDGAYLGSKDTAKTGMDDSNGDMSLGGPGGTYYYQGSEDEVRVYNRALSADEIGDLYRLGGQTVNASQANTANNGLVGHWTFDGADMKGIGVGATAYDRSGQNGDGVLSGTAPIVTEGKLGQALEFSGSTSIVRGSTASIYNFGTAPFSMSVWFKTTDTSTTGKIIFGKMSTSGNAYGYRLQKGDGGLNNLHFVIWQNGGNSEVFVSPAGNYLDGNWHHLVGVRVDSTTMRIYIDGEDKTSNPTVTSRNVDNNGPICIGNDDWTGSLGLGGSIDEARIYNRALSADEVGDLYRLGHATISK